MQAKILMRRILVGISLALGVSGCVLAHAPDRALSPKERPDDLGVPLVAMGPICGSPNIIGRSIPPIPGRLPGCGIADPVLVNEVHGIRLSQPARMDCPTASALEHWTQDGVLDVVGSYRGGVQQYQVAAHYVCRTRYNRPTAKLSEHARGKAIDISGFVMGDGRQISLIQDWGNGRPGTILRRMHDTACGIFGTVLGPNANAAHADHFHFDTARYDGGSYCR
ncbi:MAG: extensin family protein [Pseudomonadota bacterium]